MSPGAPWVALLVAAAAWWASTGVILRAVALADRGGPGAQRMLCLMSLPVLGAGALALTLSLSDPGALGDYLGFFGALAIWGWIELAFLTGAITGPAPLPCPPGLSGWARFWSGFGTVAYHEAALVLALLAIFHLSDGAANSTGLLIFSLLFAARISAKLNLFFGVPRVHGDLLPRPLAHLPSHFRIRPMTWLMPLSLALLLWAMLAAALRGAESAAPRHVLLATLAGLALLEHLLMILPLPDDKLWRWMLPAGGRPARPKPFKEDANGI
ncbi:MAG: putative photosynthetic complex assembly protein PuhE [Silicimonas sp.]|nr:putative photosynthetic complex assembly protein PuhE [Silicimonas sp.]